MITSARGLSLILITCSMISATGAEARTVMVFAVLLAAMRG